MIARWPRPYSGWFVVCVDGGPMKEINVFEFYRLAEWIFILRRAIAIGPEAQHFQADLFVASSSIGDFYNDWCVPMNICEEATKKLLETIRLANDQFVQTGAVSKWQLGAIESDIRTLETVLAHELPKLATYIVPQRGFLSTRHLVGKAGSDFQFTNPAVLSDQVTADFRQAARCIAFDLPTATAFHLWRAVESAMREYYDVVTAGKARLVDFPTWAHYLREIRNHHGDPAITAVLEQISSLHRNPNSHPEESIEMDEALALWGVAHDAIWAIGTDMVERIAEALA